MEDLGRKAPKVGSSKGIFPSSKDMFRRSKDMFQHSEDMFQRSEDMFQYSRYGLVLLRKEARRYVVRAQFINIYILGNNVLIDEAAV